MSFARDAIPAVDLLVVGAGIAGLATALASADRGLDVRCVEAARPGAGQSAGSTRIFRHRHAEPGLVELAVAARRGWTRWEERFGCELVGRDGVLVVNSQLDEQARRLGAAGGARAMSSCAPASTRPGWSRRWA